MRGKQEENTVLNSLMSFPSTAVPERPASSKVFPIMLSGICNKKTSFGIRFFSIFES